MICTVTGVAPFVSYVRTLFTDWKKGTFAGDHQLYLLNGASRSWEFGYREELERYAREAPWFTYVPTISRAHEDDKWQGETGRADDVLRKLYGERKAAEARLKALEERECARFRRRFPPVLERGDEALAARFRLVVDLAADRGEAVEAALLELVGDEHFHMRWLRRPSRSFGSNQVDFGGMISPASDTAIRSATLTG